MKRALLAAGLCLVACFTLGGAGSGRASATVENIREVPPRMAFMTGQVEQSKDEGTTWTAPSSEFRLDRGSLLRTGGDGSCVLVFEDHSLVAMKPDTTIQILPPAPDLRLALLSGKAWVRFDYAVQDQRNGITLPQATVSALGAGSYGFEVTRSTSVVKVLEGSVAVAPPGGAPRANVAVGQTLTAGPDGLQPATLFDVDLERADWQPLLGQAGLSATTTTLPATTTSRPLPPDGPVGIPGGAIVVLAVLGGSAVAFLAIVGTLIYLLVNRLRRRRRTGR
jgi:hypothetical protein